MMRSVFFRQRGAALVIVLGFLVLLLVLTVSLLRTASSERASVSLAEKSSITRSLSETAVRLAQAQIQQAANAREGTWTTQPGMARVFDASGNLARAYKLYSAPVLSTTSVDLVEDLPPSDWAALRAMWVDLNQPRVVNGTSLFPIVDPGTEDAPTSDVIEGFSLAADIPGASPAQPAPMPVRWLYVLADGRILSPQPGASGDEVVFGGPDGPTTANPIVGRIAFWTDDESSKVNVNTASFPTYFDTPRFQSSQDRALANSQPALREYQRYPGHPATMSLAAIFANPVLDPAGVFDLAPRVARGGSTEGSVATNPFGSTGASAVTLDADRLYSSPTEVLFRNNRSRNPSISPALARALPFFVTAQSRSPELNPFGLPKIAIWPIHATNSTQTRTAYDQLMARVAEIQGRPYFFQRRNPRSPVDDYNAIPRNRELFQYLQTLTALPMPGIPGGLSLLQKMGPDRDQMLTQIFDYVRSTNLHDDNLAASAGVPFTAGRSGTTLQPGHGWVTPIQIGNTRGFGRFFTISEMAFHFICTGDAENAASNNPATNRTLGGTALVGAGEARERRVQMAILLELFSSMQGYTQLAPEMRIEISGLSTLRLNGTALFPNNSETLVIQPEAVEAVSPLGGYGGFRTTLIARGKTSDTQRRRVPARGPIPSDSGLTAENSYPFVSNPVTVTGNRMTYECGPLEVRVFAGADPGAELVQTLRVIPPETSSLPVPGLVSSKTPDTSAVDAPPNWWGFHHDGAISGARGRFFFVRESPGVATSTGDSLRPGGFLRGPAFDVVRSLVVPHGDFRLVQAAAEVAATQFVPLGNWSSAEFLQHTLREGSVVRNTHPGAVSFMAPYLSGATYGMDTGPDFPLNPTATPQATGDFDTGVGSLPDGPFTNKPDEGSIRRSTATNLPYYSELERQDPPGPTFFTPSRLIASPVAFGSLPTHVFRGQPWRTLLFRPQAGHPNAQNSPPDYAWLEFFWMPVVEPYAISEPFSTDGKVNLNSQILPFTYIMRETALRALLAGELIAAVPVSAASTYKRGNSAAANPAFRRPIDVDATLSQFRSRFDSGAVFRVAGELCDTHLVPAGESPGSMDMFWANHALTGENLRERPYATVYPRATTRSNTFTVHYRAQALQKSPHGSPTQWLEGRDTVAGEMRGAVTIERFLDPNTPGLPADYAESSDPLALPKPAEFYRWRTLRNQPFGP